MTQQTLISVFIGATALVISVATTLVIVGIRWGNLSTRVATIENQLNKMDWSKLISDVDSMKTDLNQIKGMFRLTLKDLD